MVVHSPNTWIYQPDAGDGKIEILAFEAAATMARIVSLHRSLSDEEVRRLRSEAMRSQGVAYLNSTDQHHLLRLACAEMVAELDRAADVVSRLGQRGCGALTLEFGQLYVELKAGSADPRLISRSAKGIERRVKRMEQYVSSTAKLCAEMEVLAELEAAELKLTQRWSRYSGPIPTPSPPPPDSVRLEIKFQRHRVRRLKQESLWDAAFDKAVILMARSAAAVFVKICSVFGPFVSDLPPTIESPVARRFGIRIFPARHSSGPIQARPVAKNVIIRNSCPIIGIPPATKPLSPFSPPASTVGGSGLAMRYANVILEAERVLLMSAAERREAAAEREEIYELLPTAVRAAVKGKLREWWRRRGERCGPSDGDLAEGWLEAAGRILGWLAAVARDTVKWQEERNMDRRRRFDCRPRVLVFGTLHWSDREKTEAAIAEVLVGLSLVCCYEERRSGSMRF